MRRLWAFLPLPTLRLSAPRSTNRNVSFTPSPHCDKHKISPFLLREKSLHSLQLILLAQNHSIPGSGIATGDNNQKHQQHTCATTQRFFLYLHSTNFLTLPNLIQKVYRCSHFVSQRYFFCAQPCFYHALTTTYAIQRHLRHCTIAL